MNIEFWVLTVHQIRSKLNIQAVTPVVFLCLGFLVPTVVAETFTYDFYELGIRNAEITVDFDENSITIRKRDGKTNQWQAEASASLDRIDELPKFQLKGALGSFPSRMDEVRQIVWSSVRAVGWPDAESIYVKHREITEQVDDRQITAAYWALRDATLPVDLVIAADNELIAAVDPTNDICLVRRGYEKFTTLKRWSDERISRADHGYRELAKSMVAMPDGVKLTTLVYLPDDGTTGSYPVVLIRTPYGIGDLVERYWHYCARGYALVLQACRATCYWDPANKSEGRYELCINEVDDGAAALEWITQQPWCDGNIGMQGGSYVAYTQWTAAMSRNPALKCIIPEVSMGTVFSDQPYMGGGFVQGIAYYALFMMDQKLSEGRTWSEVLAHRPLIELDSFATGKDLPPWNTLLEHWSNDAYWEKQDWYRADHSRDFASFQITGWFDDDFLGTRRNWELIQQKSSRPQRLIIGPWKHGYNRDRKLNGFSFGSDALRNDIWLLKRKWFDRFLKGIENGVEQTTVEYFVVGSNQWRTSTRWPPPEAKSEKWYLHSGGKAHSLITDGGLNRFESRGGASRHGAASADRYRYDPADPPPNWMSFEQMTRWEDVQTFPYDFRDIEARHDVVTYTSEPLEEEVTVAGDITAVVYASTDARDTDWWVHVSDVHPDGSSVRWTVGLLRARFRNLDDKQFQVFGSNFQKENLLSGSMKDVVRYEIAVPAMAVTFKQGHRIRVAVANACDNYSFPNSNTGGDEATVTRTVVGKMAIHHTERYPSHVILPILPD